MTVGRDLEQGFEAVEKKVTSGLTTCDEFCSFIKGRISVENQSAKGLLKLSATSKFPHINRCMSHLFGGSRFCRHRSGRGGVVERCPCCIAIKSGEQEQTGTEIIFSLRYCPHKRLPANNMHLIFSTRTWPTVCWRMFISPSNASVSSNPEIIGAW